MKTLPFGAPSDHDELFLTPLPRDRVSAPLAMPATISSQASSQLLCMFRDPRVLNAQERGNLIAELRKAVALEPQTPEVKVLLGMALCVDLQAQEALEELREAVKQAPDCFVARLKFGELLMRLRICDQAEEHTHCAARLASNSQQSEMARRQAATIRTMLREGIERGGYSGLISRILPFRRKSRQQSAAPFLTSSK